MPDAIGAASIEILPDTTAFLPRTQAAVSSSLAKVQATVTVEANVLTPPAATGFAAMEQAALAAKAAAAGAGANTEAQKDAMIRASHAAEEEEAALNALRDANTEYSAVLKGQIKLENEDHVAKLKETRATEAQAASARALTAVSSGTSDAMRAEIESAVGLTEGLDRLAAAQLRAAETSRLQQVAGADTTKTIGSQALALTGFSGELTAAAVAAFVLFESLQNRSDFEDHMNAIKSATKATREEMEKTSQVAIDLGRDLSVPSASAIDAAQAIEDLTHAGFTLEDSQKLARTALLESAAAGEDVSTAVGQVTGLVLAYHTAVNQATEDTDALTAAQLAGVGSADEVANSLNRLGPSARSLGLGIRDISTFLIQLGNEGIDAGTATTQLDALLRRLAGNTTPVQEALKRLGLSIRDLEDEQGKFRPEAFVALGEALKKLDPQERRQIENQLASARGVKALDTLITQGLPGFEAAAERAHELGATQEEANVATQGFGGQLRELQLTLSDTATEIGKLTAGPALFLVKVLNQTATVIQDFVFGIDVMIHKVDELAKHLAAPAHAIGGFFKSVKDGIPGADLIGHFVEKTGKLALLGPALGPAGTAFEILGDRARSGSDKAGGAIDELQSHVKKDIDAIVETILKGSEDIKHGLGGGVTQFSAVTKFAIDQAMNASQDILLADARNVRQRALARLARDQARLAKDPNVFGVGGGAARLQKDAGEVTAARGEVSSILGDIAADRQKQASAAKDAADKASQARQDQHTAVLGAISAEEARREAAVTHAQTTATVADDVKTEVALRNFYRRSIETVKREIAAAKKAGDDFSGLKAALQTLNIARQGARDTIRKLRQQQRQEASDTRVESAQLDEQILETRIGDDPSKSQKQKLISSHQRIIAALKEAQRMTKERSVEWKRLQLEIEQEHAAIRALRAKKKEAETATTNFQKQEFAFLQTLHGFDENLIGNLIPGMATAGLVGGSSAGTTASTAGMLGRPTSHPAVDTSKVRPVTTGQGNTQITLLRQIRLELKKLNSGQEHPEGHHQRKVGASALDNQFQNSHGM